MKKMSTEILYANIMYITTFVVLVVVTAISLYGAVKKPNIIKKIIMLTIFGDTANLLAIFLGYRMAPHNVVPVIPVKGTTPIVNVTEYAARAVDPLPQALVLTAVVINLAVTALITALAIQIYRLYGTLESPEINKLRG